MTNFVKNSIGKKSASHDSNYKAIYTFKRRIGFLEAVFCVDCDKRAYDLVRTQSLYVPVPSLLRKGAQKSLYESALHYHRSGTNTDQCKDQGPVIYTKRVNRISLLKNSIRFN